MGAFSAEIAIILLGYLVGNVVVETSFLFLTVMTTIAMALFIAGTKKQTQKSQRQR